MSVLPCIPRCEYLLQGAAARWAKEVLYLEVWPEQACWAARWHACSNLVIKTHRRVVEIVCKFFGAAEELEEDASASNHL
jgi:hypothetical protein